MTSRRRKGEERRLIVIDVVGKGAHPVDPNYVPKALVRFRRASPKAPVVAYSLNPLISELLGVIQDALAHALDHQSAPYPIDFDALATNNNLTERQARCLELRLAGHLWSEIADLMDIKESTARGYVARALSKLRTRIPNRDSGVVGTGHASLVSEGNSFND